MKSAIRVLLLSLLLILVNLPVSAADVFKLTILHTNDLHGMMLPHDYPGDFSYLKGKHPNMGGLARRATLVAQIRRETKHPVIIVDTGDLFTDGPWAAKWFGIPEIEALNAMRYDLFGVGNNEFQATFDATAQPKMLMLIRRSRFPWLAANLTVAGSTTPVEGIHPFVVRTFGDVRVGFVGLVPRRVADYAWIKGWSIENPISAAHYWVPIARKECDILIITAHLDAVTSQELARQIPGVDAVIGGDSHTFIPTPIMVKGPKGNMVPVVQAGEKGVVLGRFDLTFSHRTGWHLVDAKEKLIPITAAVREDPAIRKLLARYLDVPKAPAPAKKAVAPVLAPAG